MRVLPIGALMLLLMLAACSTPETMTRQGLVNAGISRPVAACMASRMVDRLSILQLRRLAGLGKAERSRDLDQFLYRVRSLQGSGDRRRDGQLGRPLRDRARALAHRIGIPPSVGWIRRLTLCLRHCDPRSSKGM